MCDLNEEELQELYAWIDEISLSRQRKNFTRDFSDGVLAAEVVHHFLPRMVDLHNFSPANATQQKVDNWRTLNRKVLVRLNFSVPDDLIQSAAVGKQGVIEFILYTLRNKIEQHLRNLSTKQSFSEDMFIPPPQERYNPEDMVTTKTRLPWLQDGYRHTTIGDGPSQQDYSSPQQHMYPLGESNSPSSKPHPFPSSHIPIPSNRKNSNYPVSTRKIFPPLVQLVKPPPPPPPKKKPIKYSHNGRGLPTINRENSTSIRLRLAERDQKLLETHEYIQYLQMKLTRYEHLVQIKDMKIEDLKKQLLETKLASYQRR